MWKFTPPPQKKKTHKKTQQHWTPLTFIVWTHKKHWHIFQNILFYVSHTHTHKKNGKVNGDRILNCQWQSFLKETYYAPFSKM